MSAFEFKITRRVEFVDTDMEGIMHFSNFFRFMESAEHAFLRSLGYSAVLSRNGLQVGLPRVHAECDYLAPLRFEDEVQIHLLVQRKGGRSLTYQFRFHRLDGSTMREVARGLVTVACAARQEDGSFKAVPLPTALANRIQEAPRDLLADGRHLSRARKSDEHRSHDGRNEAVPSFRANPAANGPSALEPESHGKLLETAKHSDLLS